MGFSKEVGNPACGILGNVGESVFLEFDPYW